MQDKMTTVRSFIAVEIPADVRFKIMEYISHLAAKVSSQGVKWVNEAQLHITLKFLGNVSLSVLEGLNVELSRHFARCKPFCVSVGGPGFFPDERSPRVLWMGIDDGARMLVSAADIVESVTARYGFQKEKRKFTPHITVARIKNPSAGRKIFHAVRKLKVPPIDAFAVNSIVIMKSELLPTGARYSKLHEIAFNTYKTSGGI